jgi:hypothetical protein
MIIGANQFFQNFQFDNLDNKILTDNCIKYLSKEVILASIQELKGSLSQGETIEIDLAFNQNLGQDYQGQLSLETDDYDNPLIALNYNLNAIGQPRSILKRDSILFDSTYVNYPLKRSFFVINGGTDNMEALPINSSSSFVFSSGDSKTLAPGDTLKTRVTFNQDTTNLYSERLQIECSDSIRSVLAYGYGLIPPKLNLVADTIFISSMGSEKTIKKLVFSNDKGTTPLRYSWNLTQSKRSLRWTPFDTATYSGKVIGISDLKRYESNVVKHPFSARNGVVDLKTPLSRNSFEIDSLDVIVLDEKLWKLSKAQVKKINEWIKYGGYLYFQTDQIYDQEKFNLLFLGTSIKQIKRYSGPTFDSLKSIYYHPITKGVKSIWSGPSNAYIETVVPYKVLIEDISGNPFMVWDSYGEGKIIATSYEVFSNSPQDESLVRLIDQSFDWFFNEEEFWLSTDTIRSGKLNGGENTKINFSILPVEYERREAAVTFTSNDPDSIHTLIIHMDENDFSNTAPFVKEGLLFSVNENTYNNTIIGTIKGFDLESDTIYYGNISDKGGIAILSDGAIYVSDSSIFDFEKNRSLVREILLTDKKDTSYYDLEIDVLNINEVPVFNDTIMILDKNSKVNTIIGRLMASDPENDVLTYSMDFNDFFNILENGDLVVKKALNFESNPSYELSISSNDGEFIVQANLSIKTPPSIISISGDYLACLGDHVTFSIEAVGSDLEYHWQVDEGSGYTDLSNDEEYSGVNQDVLSIDAAIKPMSGNQYRCVVTNLVESVYSDQLSLSVDEIDPQIMSTTNDQQIDSNEICLAVLPDYSIGIVVTDNCDTNLEIIQWPEAGTIISGLLNMVTLSVSDAAWNTEQVSFNVEVVDTINPQITSNHDNQRIDADGNCEAVLSDYTIEVIATDN